MLERKKIQRELKYRSHQLPASNKVDEDVEDELLREEVILSPVPSILKLQVESKPIDLSVAKEHRVGPHVTQRRHLELLNAGRFGSSGTRTGLSGFIKTHPIRPAAGLSSTGDGRAGRQGSVFFHLRRAAPAGLARGKRWQLQPSNALRTRCLALAIADIVWRAGGHTRAVVTLLTCYEELVTFLQQSVHQGFDEARARQSLLGQSSSVERPLLPKRYQTFFQTLLFEAGPYGCVLLTLSAILSRSTELVRQDFDVPTSHLIGAHGYCTQELVNLLLTGKAVSNVFNDVVELDSGNGNITLLKGIAARSDIGFLSLFEHYSVCQSAKPLASYPESPKEVGCFLKTPRFPIWVVCSESHFSVLFSLQLELLQDWRAERLFDLYYYDGLATQQEQIRLTIDTTQTVPEDRDNDLVPPLELCIRTKSECCIPCMDFAETSSTPPITCSTLMARSIWAINTRDIMLKICEVRSTYSLGTCGYLSAFPARLTSRTCSVVQVRAACVFPTSRTYIGCPETSSGSSTKSAGSGHSPRSSGAGSGHSPRSSGAGSGHSPRSSLTSPGVAKLSPDTYHPSVSPSSSEECYDADGFHQSGSTPKRLIDSSRSASVLTHTGNSLKHPGSKESLNSSTSNGTSDADHVDAHDMTDDKAEAGSMDEHERLSHISYHRLGLEWILLRRIPGTKWFRWSNGSSQTFMQEAKDPLPKSHTTAFWWLWKACPYSAMGGARKRMHISIVPKRAICKYRLPCYSCTELPLRFFLLQMTALFAHLKGNGMTLMRPLKQGTSEKKDKEQKPEEGIERNSVEGGIGELERLRPHPVTLHDGRVDLEGRLHLAKQIRGKEPFREGPPGQGEQRGVQFLAEFMGCRWASGMETHGAQAFQSP
ncbi:hypothetical protein EI555_009102, partial [Monodon monoceros]